MKYISTRGNSPAVPSAEAIKLGLAADGGLYMPDELPELDDVTLHALCGMSYGERAAKILHMFLGDSYSYDALYRDTCAAYDETVFPGGAAPIKPLGDNIRVLELWHGPTAAFKDMALQIMPRLLTGALNKTGEKHTALILVATSGDTGKAALEGYRDVPGVKIMVFYPAGGVSRVQKLQMATQTGTNVAVQSVVGNFDDTQNGVKRIFGDAAMCEELKERGYIMSSANSINWGRLAPQTVYYISAYCDLINSGDIKLGEEINICVPTGNFGNILAAFIAKQMGLPVNRLICASNSNKVLTDFFESGVYDRNREFHMTMSPSMDILISSNLERLLYLAAGSEATSDYMKKLRDTGRYGIAPGLHAMLNRSFTGMFCGEEETSREIASVWNKYHYLIDTHTAVAMSCAERYLEAFPGGRKLLVCSTASAFKFAPSVYGAITGRTDVPELEAADKLSALTGVAVPGPLADIANRKIRFDPDKKIEADMMEAAVKDFTR